METSKNDPVKRERDLVYTPAFTKSAEHLRSASIAHSSDKGVGISPMKGNAGEKSWPGERRRVKTNLIDFTVGSNKRKDICEAIINWQGK